MRIPGVQSQEINKVVSKLDIKPTLSYVSGIEDDFSLGNNIFGNKDFACLNNGVIVTNDYYYNGNWYNIKSGEKIDLDNIEEEQKRQFEYYKSSMEQEITISNSVILNNLLK